MTILGWCHNDFILYSYNASYRRGWKCPEHAYVERRHRHINERDWRGKVMTYNHRGQSHEPQREIHTDRTDNHYEGLVPTTYPCPQLSSWLVQVLAVTTALTATSLLLFVASLFVAHLIMHTRSSSHSLSWYVFLSAQHCSSCCSPPQAGKHRSTKHPHDVGQTWLYHTVHIWFFNVLVFINSMPISVSFHFPSLVGPCHGHGTLVIIDV